MTGMRAVQTDRWSRGLTLPLRLTLSRPGRREGGDGGGGGGILPAAALKLINFVNI